MDTYPTGYNLPQIFHFSFFISSHILSELEEMCTHVAVLEASRLLYAGKLSGLIQRMVDAPRELILRYLDCDTQRVQRVLSEFPQVEKVLEAGVHEARLRWRGREEDSARLVQALVEAGVDVAALAP